MVNQVTFIGFYRPPPMQITPQHNSLKTRITPELATAFRYLIYKHSTFLRHKVIRALSHATVHSIIMVIIVLKTL